MRCAFVLVGHCSQSTRWNSPPVEVYWTTTPGLTSWAAYTAPPESEPRKPGMTWSCRGVSRRRTGTGGQRGLIARLLGRCVSAKLYKQSRSTLLRLVHAVQRVPGLAVIRSPGRHAAIHGQAQRHVPAEIEQANPILVAAIAVDVQLANRYQQAMKDVRL